MPGSQVPDGLVSPPQHGPGVNVRAGCVVVLNALGYIGFKVITTSGDSQEYLWTLERNLDTEISFPVSPELQPNT